MNVKIVIIISVLLLIALIFAYIYNKSYTERYVNYLDHISENDYKNIDKLDLSEQQKILIKQNKAIIDHIKRKGYPIVIYTDIDFMGTKKFLNIGTFSLTSLGLSDKSIQSIRVAPGFQITLFENSNFSGKSILINDDISDLSKISFDNLTSSIKIERINPQVIIYTDVNYTGINQILLEGSYDVNNMGVPNDSIRSVKVSPGYRVLLYEDANFQGKKLTLERDSPNLNATTSSLKVEKIANLQFPVNVFTGINYTGSSNGFIEGKYDINSLGVPNDSIKSIKVASGYKVTLYEDANFQGKTVIIDKDKASLDDVGFSGKTSGIKIERK